jgi:[pyruvate, water dikinase]-phosphate phosphotransferase / [pyruvate, water dikinase] kinase
VKQLHLHLISDSTGETLDMVASACLAQFDTVEALRHVWPMVRSEGHLDRVLDDIEKRPGLVLYTLVNPAIRRDLERKCRQRKIHAVPVLGGQRRGGQGARRAPACARRRLFRPRRRDPVHHRP